MLAEELELAGGPAPVLKHLRGRFDEVLDSARAVEAGVGRHANEVVDSMAKFYKGNVSFGLLAA